MSVYYHEAHAQVDPDSAEQLPNGRWRQEIELIFIDDPDRPLWKALEPVVCALDAAQARDLAFELVMLAEVAEQWEQAK
jgi:hypothetical protein